MSDNLKEIRAKLRKLRKQEKYWEEKQQHCHKKLGPIRIKIYDLDYKKRELTHKFEKNDYVVIRGGDVAKVFKCIGAKRYEIFKYWNRRIGTTHKIHEKEIICSIGSLKQFFELKYLKGEKQK